MLLKDKKIGFALTGSFCTFEKTIPQISNLSNIISKIEQQRNSLAKQFGTEIPFTVKQEQSSEFGRNSISIFVHCPRI